MNTKLTAKQEEACQQYLLSGNKSEAYRNAYNCENMKPETVNVRACKFFNEAKISTRVAELIDARNERHKIDADYVLKRLVEIDEMDVMDILDNTGNMKPINEWPKCWRRTISGLDIQEIMNGDTASVLRKIKWPDKVKNLELLGKHVDVQAFKDKVQHEGGLVDEMAELMKGISNAATE